MYNVQIVDESGCILCKLAFINYVRCLGEGDRVESHQMSRGGGKGVLENIT